MHIARHAKVGRVDDLVGRGIAENCLGVNAGLSGSVSLPSFAKDLETRTLCVKAQKPVM